MRPKHTHVHLKYGMRPAHVRNRAKQKRQDELRNNLTFVGIVVAGFVLYVLASAL